MTRRFRSSTGPWPASWPSGPRPEAEPRCRCLQGASALFDMIEYYESATHLNISFNKHIGTRGWQAAAHMMRKVGTPAPPPASPGWKELRHRGVQALCQGTQPCLAHPQEPRLDLPPGVSTSHRFPGCKTRWPRCSVGLGWAVPQGREGWGQPEPAPLLPPDQLPAVPGRPQHAPAGPLGALRGPRPAHPQQPGGATPGECQPVGTAPHAAR